MAQVRFNLRKNTSSDPHIQLIYRLDADRSKAVIGTGLHVPEKHWNKKNMRVRESAPPMYHHYNSILEDWQSAVNSVLKMQMLNESNLSLSKFKEEVSKIFKGTNVSNSKTSFEVYFENFIAIKKSAGLKVSTLKQYQNALNKFNEFRIARMNRKKLEFDDLTEHFFINFIKYLSIKCQQNTVNKIIRRIRAVLNHATMKGVNTLMDYKSPNCQVSYIHQPKIYLNQLEIEQIKKLSLLPNSRLDRVRDRFIIGLRTGLRYSDFSRVSAEHETIFNGNEIIEIKTQKTQKIVRIPLAEDVKHVLRKYDGYPPAISEVKFNRYIKEICELAKIDATVSRVEDGKQFFYPKWKLVSSHICRRSFATNAYKSGLHPNQLMPITGHSDIRVFMNYICIDEEENLEGLVNHEFFK